LISKSYKLCEISDRTIDSIRGALQAADYAGWYRNTCGDEYIYDPWVSFAKAREAIGAAGWSVREPVFGLFLLGRPVAMIEAKAVLGAGAVNELVNAGFLSVTPDGMMSRYRVLSSFDQYLVIEAPDVNFGSTLISSGVYLSGSSYTLIRWALYGALHGFPREGERVQLRISKALDLGCGAGILSVALSRGGIFVMATDIDPNALQIARLNIRLNDCIAPTLQADLFDGVPATLFDLIVFNPPWRLVPPDIAYPTPLARVGRGKDGLDIIRRFIKEVPAYMSFGGRALFFSEFPGDSTEFEFAAELKSYAGDTKCSVSLLREYPVTVEEQSRISARTSWHLNPQMPLHELARRYLSNYRALGFSHIHPVKCQIRNDGVGEFSCR
jgi:SAM-dependent methyltransferase